MAPDESKTAYRPVSGPIGRVGTIHVQCICPPIPVRFFDYVAWWDGHEEAGYYGYGKTAKEAVAELIEQGDEDATP